MSLDLKLTGTEIRQLFLDFFASKGHLIMPSSSLVPRNDPTVLLTTAGISDTGGQVARRSPVSYGTP